MTILLLIFKLIFTISWVLHSGLIVLILMEIYDEMHGKIRIQFMTRDHDLAETAARSFCLYSWALASGILLTMWGIA